MPPFVNLTEWFDHVRGRIVSTRCEAATENGRWAQAVIVTDLPRRHAASAQFAVEDRAEVGGSAAIIIVTGPSTPQVHGVDARFLRPFEDEEIADKVARPIGDEHREPTPLISLPAGLDTHREVLCDSWSFG